MLPSGLQLKPEEYGVELHQNGGAEPTEQVFSGVRSKANNHAVRK
jgi:hypothetical protein